MSKNLHFYWDLTSCGKDAEILLVARDRLYQNPLSRRVYVVAPGRKNGDDLRETALPDINSASKTPEASEEIRIIFYILHRNGSVICKGLPFKVKAIKN